MPARFFSELRQHGSITDDDMISSILVEDPDRKVPFRKESEVRSSRPGNDEKNSSSVCSAASLSTLLARKKSFKNKPGGPLAFLPFCTMRGDGGGGSLVVREQYFRDDEEIEEYFESQRSSQPSLPRFRVPNKPSRRICTGKFILTSSQDSDTAWGFQCPVQSEPPNSPGTTDRMIIHSTVRPADAAVPLPDNEGCPRSVANSGKVKGLTLSLKWYSTLEKCSQDSRSTFEMTQMPIQKSTTCSHRRQKVGSAISAKMWQQSVSKSFKTTEYFREMMKAEATLAPLRAKLNARTKRAGRSKALRTRKKGRRDICRNVSLGVRL
jgi:hypothetical protein